MSSIQSKVTDVSINSEDENFAHAVSHGVEDDSLNYSRLFFWSGLGVVTVTFFIVVLIFFAQYSVLEAQRTVSNTTSYLEITKLKADQEAELNSYGVVDLEKGIYHIPIDKAIDKIVVD